MRSVTSLEVSYHLNIFHLEKCSNWHHFCSNSILVNFLAPLAEGRQRSFSNPDLSVVRRRLSTFPLKLLFLKNGLITFFFFLNIASMGCGPPAQGRWFRLNRSKGTPGALEGTPVGYFGTLLLISQNWHDNFSSSFEYSFYRMRFTCPRNMVPVESL